MTTKNKAVGRGAKSRQEKVEETRPVRIPVAEQRDKLNVIGQDPNRHYHWINDNNDGQRIFMLEQAGYRIETDKSLTIGTRKMSDSDGQGSAHRKYAGMDKEGNKIYTYLMSIDMKFYEEDQLAKQKIIDLKEEGSATQGDYGEVTFSDDTRNGFR